MARIKMAVFAYLVFISCILLIDATEVAWNVDGNNLWASNCDFRGQNLPNRPTTNNIQECGKKCSDDPECDHFTWYKSDKTCYLKKGQWPDNEPTPLVNAQCGYIPGRLWNVDANGVTWKNNCDFKGQDLEITPNPIPKINQQDCGTRCLINPPCDHFTWSPVYGNNQNVCFLKQGSWPANTPTSLANARCGFIPVKEWKIDANVFWADNCDFPGKNLTSTPNTTPQQCRKMCSDNLFCDHFTWWVGDATNKNMCYLKRGDWPVNRPYPLPDAQCGYISEGRKWTENRNVVSNTNCGFASPNKPYNFVGDGVMTANTNSLDVCARSCNIAAYFFFYMQPFHIGEWKMLHEGF
jgi:hypothetical protein